MGTVTNGTNFWRKLLMLSSLPFPYPPQLTGGPLGVPDTHSVSIGSRKGFTLSPLVSTVADVWWDRERRLTTYCRIRCYEKVSAIRDSHRLFVLLLLPRHVEHMNAARHQQAAFNP